MKHRVRHPPLFWILVLLSVCALFFAIYSIPTVKEALHHNLLVGGKKNVDNAETDIELRTREEKKWGKFILNTLTDLREKALRPPTDDEVKERLLRSVYGVDPYSGYKNNAEYDAGARSKEQRYDGVGVDVVMESLGARVENVHIMSPAESADVRIGDVITHIVFGRETIALANSYAHGRAEFLQKNLGRTMRLSLLRGNKKILTRAMHQVNAVAPSVDHVQRLSGDYGLIRIRWFSEHRTASEFLYALRYLLRDKGLSGLIIDLRGNLGGYLDQGVECAGYFVPRGTITGYRYDRKNGKTAYLAASGDTFLDFPIVILVDGDTASTSEYLIGALVDRDEPRAIVMGSKTRAKGVGQTTEQAPDGLGMSTVTTMELFTPRGNAIDKKGFTPDDALFQKYRDIDHPDQLVGAAVNYLKDI